MDSARPSTRQYHVLSEMTAQGEMTVADPSTSTVFQVMGYQDDALHDRLASVNTGSIVTIGLERAGTRANAFIAYRPPEGLRITHNPPLQLETRVRMADDGVMSDIKYPVLRSGSDDTTPPTV